MSGKDYASKLTRDIYLNIYDLHGSNSLFGHLGLGLYHTGVEIADKEYSFSNQGIARTNPQLPEFGVFKEKIKIGTFNLDMEFLASTLASLAATDFSPNTYNIITKNCNHFSNALCISLCGVGIPTWINRAASIGSTLSTNVNNKEISKRYSPNGLNKINAIENVSNKSSFSSSFSSMIWGKPLVRSTVQGKVSILSEKKELSEKQRILLDNLKSKK